jgi:hypothetical protein
VQVANDGIVLHSAGAGEFVLRPGLRGVSYFDAAGRWRLRLDNDATFVTDSGGSQLALAGGGAFLETPNWGSLTMDSSINAAKLSGPNNTFVNLGTHATTVAGYGGILSMEAGGTDLSGPGHVQLISALIGLNGACKPVARVGDMVHNSYQFDGGTGIVGWPVGLIDTGSNSVFTC